MSESIITKKAIADSLKQLMINKPFEKITISDITNNCGLNRLTFYYHFQDKFELLDWIYYNEIIMPFSKDLSFDNWTEKFDFLFSMMKENEDFYKNALKYSDSEFQKYIFDVSKKQFEEIIKRVTSKNGMDVDEKNMVFIAEFFSHGIVGVILDWALDGMKSSPKELTDHFNKLVLSCEKMAIGRYFGSIN